MTNPFDAEPGAYSVLVNTAGQHSLWPGIADIPTGWSVAHGPAGRAECLNYVNTHWVDLRPRGLVAELNN